MAKSVLIVGGTSGIGKETARYFAEVGDHVTLTGRDAQIAASVAKEIGGDSAGLALDLAEPDQIAGALAGIQRVDRLVLAAIERDLNTAADYDVPRAKRLVTLKLVGYTEVIHVLLPRMGPGTSIVLFGGMAVERPYPGSTTVSTVNGGVIGMMHSLAVELAPIRVNAIHPGIVGDSPFWAAKPEEVLEGYRSRTPGGQLASMRDVVGAVVFLLENPAVNGAELHVNGGTLLT
jgi:NAD(P)-dependent dehydrogenase (short-subunit alcohol dehydrogenase family)